ncbi:hypothetical protein ACF8LH_04180 [Pseudomonas sp. zbq_4]|uniref:hypothetical protein n=1 Tax=Pseudomonas sp. zbq_4 TaxID=3367240 RepID=UPI00370AC5EE
MATIEVTEEADWELFEDLARMLEQGLGGCWKQKLDALDQRYRDLSVDGHTLTLHLEHYLGISMVVPDNADEIVQGVSVLLRLIQQPDIG